MSHKLVIVESPAKAKTINRFLGKEYKVIASMGHVRDLPENQLGINIKDEFKPSYIESPKKAKVIADLRASAKGVKEIFLAPDPDREGEAIAWHLKELLEPIAPKAQFHRVAFHEITKSAIEKAFANATHINMDLVDAQQARRVLDRLVGYQVSPLLWSSVARGKGISAGRVQSVALRLVTEREREILSFIPEEFWNLTVDLEEDYKGSGKRFTSRYFRTETTKEKQPVNSEKEANTILTAIENKTQTVVTTELEPRKKYPQPPFITSTLQQIAGSVLRMTSKQSMQIAQELYEGIDIGKDGVTGLITYMRTDSVNVAQEAQSACRTFISGEFGIDYMPAKPPLYRSKSNAQEAHEAIRPTDVNLTPERIANYLSPAQFKLYNLIWKRFVASQMAPALQQRATVETQAEKTPYIFRCVATETQFPGYLRVFGEEENQAKSEGLLASDDDEQILSIQFLTQLKKGDICHFMSTHAEQKFTEPPARYSEATLVRALEANGVGRPSTYASIVTTIQDRKYVVREKSRLIPTELGFKVNDYLVAHLDNLFQVGFTANMENELDLVEEGKIPWVKMMQTFYNDSFTVWIDQAKHINAPEVEKPSALIKLFSTLKNWKTPDLSSSSNYNDKKFFTSLEKQFEKSKKMTEKQWFALLRMANVYADELPELKAIAKTYQFEDDLEKMAQKIPAPLSKEQIETHAENNKALNEIFEKLKKVEFTKPVGNSKRGFDDERFITSLQSHHKKGKPLSDKQLGALQRVASKYSIDCSGLALETLPIDEAQNETILNKITPYIDLLNGVTQWDPPTKRGAKNYNDQDFFNSIRSQVEAKKTLSPRQISALEKMAARYASRSSVKVNMPNIALAPENGLKTDEDKQKAVEQCLLFLSTINAWEKAKGKFSDVNFFNSLKKQHESGRTLSEKQLNALMKLGAKYKKRSEEKE